MKYFILLSTLLFLACNQTDLPDGDCNAEGIVTEKVAGKDGFEVVLIDDNALQIHAILSIPNLGSTYVEVNIGERIYLEGDCFSLNKELHLTPDYLEKR